MFASDSGVLKQRAWPNARCSPWVVPNTPPLPSTLGEHRLAGVGHVLAEHPDPLVGGHLLVQRALDRLAHRHRLAVAVAARRVAGIGEVGQRHDLGR